MKIKICKSCGAENSPEDLECNECMGDISGIRPVDKIEKSEPDVADNPSTTARDVKKTLVLVSTSVASNGEIMPINDGDILGREHIGKDLLALHSTVSRQHAKVIHFEGEWMIEDLGSMNGTYINGRELEAGQKYTLKAKDVVALSKSCEFQVKIEV